MIPFILILTTNIYFILHIYFNHTGSFHGTLNQKKLIKNTKRPFTVSECHSTNFIGRNHLTFVFCFLGLNLLYDQLILTGQIHNLFHLSLPLISIFPLKANIEKEVIIIFEVSPTLSDLIHKILVFQYIILYLGYLTLFNIYLTPLWLCSVILIILIFKNSPFTLWYEVLYICIFPITIHYIQPII
jgi:hypothetical protein